MSNMHEILKGLKQHLSEVKQLIAEAEHVQNKIDIVDVQVDTALIAQLQSWQGLTIKCSEASMHLSFNGFKNLNEGYLKRLAKQYPDVFKIVKTDSYHSYDTDLNKFMIKTGDGLKRISCIKVFETK